MNYLSVKIKLRVFIFIYLVNIIPEYYDVLRSFFILVKIGELKFWEIFSLLFFKCCFSCWWWKFITKNLCGNKTYVVYCNILLTDTSWWLFYMYTKIGLWKNISKLGLYIVSGISWVCHGQSLSIVVENTRLKNRIIRNICRCLKSYNSSSCKYK